MVDNPKNKEKDAELNKKIEKVFELDSF